MTQQSRLRRMGWIAVLALCTVLYLGLHLKVHAVRSEVVSAERKIVALENQKTLLATEFETRASQQQLASWNRVEFGYSAPTAKQFVENERQLAQFGTPRAAGAPEPIRVASLATGEDAPAYPKFLSPLTGKPIDDRLLEPEPRRVALVASHEGGALRIPLAAAIGDVGE
jgi:hypothetical protein|uniref:hypothetical protein n=1 Tax=Altererythrobacter segetis TaxID=1104773 RepID=UPI00140867D6|nr:hypothetical protein [Altererythrobacter segetis]